MDLREIEKREHDKYSRLHKEGYGAGRYEPRLGDFIKQFVTKDDRILEIGAGQGLIVDKFAKQGYDIYGMDITLNGIIGSKERFTKAPLWRLPYKDGEFSFSYSLDVMEHIPPELMGKCIDEIYRVTSDRTLHLICDRPSIHEEGLHLIVRDGDWWRTQFSLRGTDRAKCLILSTKEFSVFRLFNQWKVDA